MGEPKTPFSLLSNFPPDVWAHISPYIPGESLPRLKLCGTKVIWRNLTAANTVKSVVLGEELVTFKRWPAFLDELPSVVELVLQRYAENWFLDMGLKLNMLPSRLQILRTNGPIYATKIMFTNDDGTTMALKDHLPHLKTLDIPHLDWEVPHFPWVFNTPENLTSLVCSSWETDAPLPASLTHLRASFILCKGSFAFPQALQTLRFNSYQDPSGNFLASLPHSLTELESVLSRVPLTLVPKNVTKLHTSYLNLNMNIHGPSDSILPLANGLKHLTVHELSPEFWDHLPRLEFLKVHHLPSKDWPSLPSGLLSLIIGEISSEDAIEDQLVTDPTDGKCYVSSGLPIRKLPRSLTECKLGPISPVLDLFSFGGTKALFFLNWTLSSSVEPESVAPSLSLKSLSELFPPYLTRLELSSFQLSPESTMQLPSTLSKLVVLNIDSAVVRYLPRRLTSLEGSVVKLNKELIEHLPQSLASLCLHLCPPENFWIDVRTGQEVQIGQIQEYQEELELADSLMSLLPPYLTTLDIRNRRNLSGSCFKNLPRYLRHLHLSTLEVYDADLQFLPPSLHHLTLPDDINLTISCLPYLPAGIGLFHIPMNNNFQVKEEFLDSMPALLLSKLSYNSFVTKSWVFSYGEASPRRTYSQ